MSTANDKDTVLLIAAVAAIFALLLTAKLVLFFVGYAKEKRYIKAEMRRAYTDEEYRHWRKELRCLRLRLLPFVTARNVRTLYDCLFRKPRHEKPSDKNALHRALLPCILAMGLCAVSLCGVSWAWFSAAKGSNVRAVQTASYTATVTVADTAALTPQKDGSFALPTGTYTVTLEAAGTAKAGFCRITLGDETYYTRQLPPGDALTFTVTVHAATTLSVMPQWGSSAHPADLPASVTVGTPAATTETPVTTAATTATTAKTATTTTTAASTTVATTAATAATTETAATSAAAETTAVNP